MAEPFTHLRRVSCPVCRRENRAPRFRLVAEKRRRDLSRYSDALFQNLRERLEEAF